MIYRFNFNPYDIVFDKIMEAEKAKFDSSTTIIHIGLGYDILSFINKFKNYKKILIINNEISKNINIKDNNLDIINVPYQIEDLIDMANDIKSEIKDSYLINLFDNKNGISAFYKYANKIIDKKYRYLILDIAIGISLGFAKYAKMKYDDIYVIGIKKYNYDYPSLDTDYFDEIKNNNDIEDNNDSLFITI